MDYTGKNIDIKHLDKYSATIEQIEEYSKNIRNNQVPCYLPPCPRCEVKSDYFTRHEARQRKFYVLVEQLIRVVIGLLIRWKCPGCGKTFTGYPSFAVPYKRYTLPTIQAFSHRYTEDDKMSYRKVMLGTHIGYSDKENIMAHTTVHRWITRLGCFNEIIRKGQELILESNPSSTLCRDLSALSIPSKKYRSIERKSLLVRCRQILNLVGLYKVTFGVSIFPKLAALCRFG